MATLSGKKNAVYLEVGFWFDETTGRVHFASTDRDLGPGGLHGSTMAPSVVEQIRAVVDRLRAEVST